MIGYTISICIVIPKLKNIVAVDFGCKIANVKFYSGS